MAYGKLIIFELKKSFDDDTIEKVDFDNCEWGWFVKENELTETMIDDEKEFQAMLSPEEMVKAVQLVNKQCETEASGGITESTIQYYAETGVDFISVGALTHSVSSLDLSLKQF